MKSIDINCDVGEGFANDALLMTFISSANIACGFHAGNENSMHSALDHAVSNNVSVGAHPGFADKANFGRAEMQLTSREIYDLVTEQIHILKTAASQHGTKLQHVKPHGALYNMSAKDYPLATTIAEAVRDTDDSLVLYGLSGSHSITAAQHIGLRTASEVFADRTYQDDGSLTPRSKPDALIGSMEDALNQVLDMILKGVVMSANGNKVTIAADTICIHGDSPHAVEFAFAIYHTLQQRSIAIQKI